MGAALAARVATLPASSTDVRQAVRGGLAEVGRIRIPEFLLFFLLSMYPLVRVSNLIGNAIIVGIVLYAMTRMPKLDLARYRNLVALIIPALVYVAAISITQEGTDYAYDWQNRLIRITAVLFFAFTIAVGRIDLRSGILGFLAAAAINIPLFYAGIASDTYGGYLTGVFGDKNVSGMAYALAIVLAMLFIDNRLMRYVAVLLFVVALWQTGSRTSMGAVAGAALWYFIAPRLNNVLGKIAIVGLIYWGIGYLTDEYAQSGVFEERVGSDALRERIDEASRVKLETAGLWGMGLGEAVVRIQDNVWSFHNSYWSALVEGGWPWLAFILILTVIVMIPVWKPSENRAQVLAEGLGVIILVISTRLGEVFLTNYWALAFATCLYFRLKPIDKRTAWEKYADSERERRERDRSQWTGTDRQGRDWRADHAARVRQIQEVRSATVGRRSRRETR